MYEAAAVAPTRKRAVYKCNVDWEQVGLEGQRIHLRRDSDVAFGATFETAAFIFNTSGTVLFTDKFFNTIPIGVPKFGWLRCNLTNHDFDKPRVLGLRYRPGNAGWKFHDLSYVAAYRTNWYKSWYAPPVTGSQVALLRRWGGVSQHLTVNGGNYRISFSLMGRHPGARAVKVSYGGVLIMTIPRLDVPLKEWKFFETPVVNMDGSRQRLKIWCYTEIGDVRTWDQTKLQGTFIDNVEIRSAVV